MLERYPSEQQHTVVADRAYGAAEFTAGCHNRRATRHVARTSPSSVARRSMLVPHGIPVTSPARGCTRVEPCFGWGSAAGRCAR